LLVDDHPIVRGGLTQLLGQEEDLDVCDEAGSVTDALAKIPRCKPDIVIVDITLEGSNGIELVKSISQENPQIAVLVLSMHDETLYAERALRAGAKGYIMKEEAPGKVLTAIRRILDGEICVSDKIASLLLEEVIHRRPGSRRRFGVERLSDRELEVFELMGVGLPTREIACKLGLSVKTVETHRAHIKRKLRTKNSSDLTRRAICWVQDNAHARQSC